jgi:hypothetical protein
MIFIWLNTTIINITIYHHQSSLLLLLLLVLLVFTIFNINTFVAIYMPKKPHFGGGDTHTLKRHQIHHHNNNYLFIF